MDDSGSIPTDGFHALILLVPEPATGISIAISLSWIELINELFLEVGSTDDSFDTGIVCDGRTERNNRRFDG